MKNYNNSISSQNLKKEIFYIESDIKAEKQFNDIFGYLGNKKADNKIFSTKCKVFCPLYKESRYSK